MPITPLDIRKKEFSTQLRGLAPKEVKGYLELIAKEVEELRRERAQLAEKVDELNARIETYARTEGLVKEALVAAQQSAADKREATEKECSALEARAQQKADGIVAGANKEAQAISDQAEAAAKDLAEQLHALEIKRQNLLDQLRGLAHSCLAMADSWEKKSERNPAAPAD